VYVRRKGREQKEDRPKANLSDWISVEVRGTAQVKVRAQQTGEESSAKL
jgi:hypothetical protein